MDVLAAIAGCAALALLAIRLMPACPSCHKRKLKARGEIDHFAIYRCAACGEECMHERGGPYIPRARWEQGAR